MLAICCNTYSNNECHLLGVQILAIVQRWMDGYGRTDGRTDARLVHGNESVVGNRNRLKQRDITGMKTPKHLVRPTSGQSNSQDREPEAMDFLQPRDPRER